MSFISSCLQRAPQRQTPVPLHETLRGEPIVLVVDDDPNVRHMVCAFLRYATKAFVLDASGPYAALEMARKAGYSIDLLISDIQLSAFKNGIDLAHEMKANNPAMKVMLMSGSDLPQSQIPPGWRFLQKPFAISELMDCVSALCSSMLRFESASNGVKTRPASC